MTCNFSLQHYIDCISKMALDNPKAYELIHDLDYPEGNILEIAHNEALLGLSAKYFIRIHSKFYNAFSLENISVYRKLKEMGHELGLHFEPSFYEESNITEAIKREAEALQNIVGVPINYVSIHEPARFGSIPENLVPSNLKYYCWDSSYYKDKKYISDSSGRWREGCMCNHIGKHPYLIVLTHPTWWYNRTSAENY